MNPLLTREESLNSSKKSLLSFKGKSSLEHWFSKVLYSLKMCWKWRSMKTSWSFLTLLCHHPRERTYKFDFLFAHSIMNLESSTTWKWETYISLENLKRHHKTNNSTLVFVPLLPPIVIQKWCFSAIFGTTPTPHFLVYPWHAASK